MLPRRIDAATAWQLGSTDPHARWQRNGTPYAGRIFPINITPKFTINASDKFFCIGSCFARNIEEHLTYCGVSVLSRRIASPRTEWPSRPAGLVNKLTTASIYNEFSWVKSPPDYTEAILNRWPKGWKDLQLAGRVKEVSLERGLERRRYLIEDYFERVRQADIVVMTLGLIEAWYDSKTDLYLNTPPSPESTTNEPRRYVLELMDAAQNLFYLEKIHALLKEFNATSRIIVTVSPVPLARTFSGMDAVLANTYAKSALRVAAEQFSSAHDNVDYFPSYEMISMAPRNLSFSADCRHVQNGSVGDVVAAFLNAYMGIEPQPLESFIEMDYLRANPDVDDAVRAGLIESGFHHWIESGRAENRPLS